MPGSVDMPLEVSSTRAIQPFTRDLLGFNPGTLLLSVEVQNIRFWYGGSAPTSTSGHQLVVGAFSRFTKTSEIENLQMIAVAGTARVFATVGGP